MTRTRRRIAVSAALLGLAAVACRQEPTVPQPPPTKTQPPATQTGGAEQEAVTVQMKSQSGSGQTGTARLEPAGSGETKVSVDLSSSPAGPQPAHIHPGTCDALDPIPKYGLTNLANGRSETTVEVGLAELLGGTFSINIHKSVQEPQVYVSCGEIAR